MQEMQVWSLGQDDPLEQSMATHSSILARKITWTEQSSGLWSIGSTRLRHVWGDWTHSWFMAAGPITSWQIEEEKVEAVTDFLFLGSKITKIKDTPWKKSYDTHTKKKSYDKPRQCIKKQGHHFANKGPYSQSDSFSSSHVQIWELDYKEGWAPKIL